MIARPPCARHTPSRTPRTRARELPAQGPRGPAPCHPVQAVEDDDVSMLAVGVAPHTCGSSISDRHRTRVVDGSSHRGRTVRSAQPERGATRSNSPDDGEQPAARGRNAVVVAAAHDSAALPAAPSWAARDHEQGRAAPERANRAARGACGVPASSTPAGQAGEPSRQGVTRLRVAPTSLGRSRSSQSTAARRPARRRTTRARPAPAPCSDTTETRAGTRGWAVAEPAVRQPGPAHARARTRRSPSPPAKGKPSSPGEATRLKQQSTAASGGHEHA